MSQTSKRVTIRQVPVNRPETRRKFGAFKGRVRVPASFFEPMPAEELAAWEH